MKKILIIALSILAISACDFKSLDSVYEDFTDLQPKGKNLLSSADELELLLNHYFQYMGFTDMMTLSSDIIDANSPVMSILSQPKKSKTSILWTYDGAAIDELAELTNSDQTYTDFYNLIGTVCNPILASVGFASGNQAKLNQDAAEAYSLRAWALYILVNKYAKAYNPATAATDTAIPFYRENDDIGVSARQWTVQEIYDQILSDTQAAIELNAIPVVAENRMRVCKSFPYAIRTFALLAMQNYSEAAKVGKECISITPDICNYYSDAYTRILTAVTNPTLNYPVVMRSKQGVPEDLLYTFDNPMGRWFSTECMDFLEPGHALHDRIADQDRFMGYMFGPSGYSAVMIGLPGIVGLFDLVSSFNPFGVKTSQVYLAVAEAEIQQGNISEAMDYIDKVRQNRIDPEVYAPLKGQVSSKQDAILACKKAAHGEGMLAVWNFVDRKRWNQLADWKQSWSRTLDQTYTITPECPLWIFPLPKNAMTLNENLKQNYVK